MRYCLGRHPLLDAAFREEPDGLFVMAVVPHQLAHALARPLSLHVPNLCVDARDAQQKLKAVQLRNVSRIRAWETRSGAAEAHGGASRVISHSPPKRISSRCSIDASRKETPAKETPTITCGRDLHCCCWSHHLDGFLSAWFVYCCRAEHGYRQSNVSSKAKMEISTVAQMRSLARESTLQFGGRIAASASRTAA